MTIGPGMTMPLSTDGRPSDANLSNWRAAPFNRWAFNNVRSIIPVAEIEHAPDGALALPKAPIALDNFELRLPNGSSLKLDGFLKATATDGVVVLHDGRIVFEFYDNGTSPETPHILMSATKAVVGLMAGILQQRGDLDVDSPVSNYVPEIAATAYRGATIRNLLDMRTGVALDEADLRAYAAASNWDPVAPGERTSGLHDFLERLAAPPGDHGGPFSYVSANTDLLGWAIERATGRTFADLVSMWLWKPMGAAAGSYITVDRKGAPRCTGGLCATVRDFARVGQLVLMKGRRGDSAVVPEAWIDDIAENGDHKAWSEGQWRESFASIATKMRYRSGWYVVDDAPRLLFAMGIHGQNLFVDAANRIVIAKVSSLNDPINPRAIWLTHKAVPEITRCILTRVTPPATAAGQNFLRSPL
jgi:CubicO group peptidase (beta-lactamase class C family)